MRILDASVLIAFLDSGDAHHAQAVELLGQAADEPFGMSVVTLAEVLVGPTRFNRHGDALRVIDHLAIESIEIPANAHERLAALGVAHGLRMPDCCVLLAAEQVGGSILTFDQLLADAATR